MPEERIELPAASVPVAGNGPALSAARLLSGRYRIRWQLLHTMGRSPCIK